MTPSIQIAKFEYKFHQYVLCISNVPVTSLAINFLNSILRNGH